MTARTARVIFIFSAFLAGLALVFGVVMLIGGRTLGPPAVASVGGPFQLIGSDGKPFSDQDLKGKPFLVFFGFTHCPEVCPTTLFEVSEIFRALGPEADRAAGLFITVDPERDTAAVMKDYLSSFDPHLKGLTGTPEAIAAVAKAYRAYFKKIPLTEGSYTMDHSALVYLMDKQGRFVAPFNVKRKPELAAADLRKYF
jgi:protein SCO1/2